MIFERKFENKTKGLVCGTQTLNGAVFQPLAIKRSKIVIADAKPRVFSGTGSFCHWKVVIESREGREILWQRPFEFHAEALEVYRRLVGADWRPGLILPSTWIDGELAYYIATVSTYNSSNSTNADWPTGNKCPSGVSSTDYLVVAGGGAGGNQTGGGGGAGGMRTSTGLSVTAGTQYTITVGGGGAGATPANGNDSTFSSITSTGGGKGGVYPGSAAGSSGGSGGGGSTGSGAGGSGTGGQGNNGGGGAATASGGGGGAGAVGTISGSNVGGAGGNGSSSSISGSAVTYAGGGGGGGNGGQAGGAGGTGGGGAGHAAGAGNGTAGTTNLGGGGGGADGGTGGDGGSGVIILSYTATSAAVYGNNSPMLGL